MKLILKGVGIFISTFLLHLAVNMLMLSVKRDMLTSMLPYMVSLVVMLLVILLTTIMPNTRNSFNYYKKSYKDVVGVKSVFVVIIFLIALFINSTLFGYTFPKDYKSIYSSTIDNLKVENTYDDKKLTLIDSFPSPITEIFYTRSFYLYKALKVSMDNSLADDELEVKVNSIADEMDVVVLKHKEDLRFYLLLLFVSSFLNLLVLRRICYLFIMSKFLKDKEKCKC